jgi:uncharacterized membrane protein
LVEFELFAIKMLRATRAKPFLYVLLAHALLFGVIVYNIPILRQIITFLYLSFVPGLVLVKILKLSSLKFEEKILFTIGLSLVFLIFVGFIVNGLLLAIGVSIPLSSASLSISFFFLTLSLSFFAYHKDSNSSQNDVDGLSGCTLFNLAPKVILIIPVVLGVFGSRYTNVCLLSLMIVSILALYGMTLFINKKSVNIFSNNYLIFLASIALIVQAVLTSRYIMGWDANAEYFVFKSVIDDGHWSQVSTETNFIPTVNLSGMLSVTILPAVYYYFMNCSGELVFKTLYPFIFSLVPVVLYKIYRKQLSRNSSILSVMFFISGSSVFYGAEPLSINRQIIATFFLVLSISVMLEKRLSVDKRRLLLIVFGGGLIVSHYSLTFIYLFLILSIFTISRFKRYEDRLSGYKHLFDFKCMVLLFLLSLLWYSFNGSILSSVTNSIRFIVSNFLQDLGALSTRGLSGAHPAGSNINFAGDIYRVFYLVVNLFLAIGILESTVGLLKKVKESSMDSGYQLMSIASSFILSLCLFIPNLAPSLNFSRFYAIALLLLSPFFVMGGELMINTAGVFWRRMTQKRFVINTRKASEIVLYVVLVGYFFSQSGLINIVLGAAPLYFPLDYSRASTSLDPVIQKNFNAIYIPEQDVFSASWFSSHKVDTAAVFADRVSGVHVLVSYGLIPENLIFQITNATIPQQGSYIYMSSLNIVNGLITTAPSSFNISEISTLLNQNCLVYTNGNSVLSYVTPIH